MTPNKKEDFRTGGEHALSLFRTTSSLIQVLEPIMDLERAKITLDDILVRHHCAKVRIADLDRPYPNRLLAGMDMDDVEKAIERLRMIVAHWDDFKHTKWSAEATAAIAYCLARLPVPDEEQTDAVTDFATEEEATVTEEVPETEMAFA
jgi:hypothetical protein